MTLDGVLYWRRCNVHAVIVANLVKHLQIVLSTLKKTRGWKRLGKIKSEETIEAEREMA